MWVQWCVRALRVTWIGLCQNLMLTRQCPVNTSGTASRPTPAPSPPLTWKRHNEPFRIFLPTGNIGPTAPVNGRFYSAPLPLYIFIYGINVCQVGHHSFLFSSKHHIPGHMHWWTLTLHVVFGLRKVFAEKFLRVSFEFSFSCLLTVIGWIPVYNKILTRRISVS